MRRALWTGGCAAAVLWLAACGQEAGPPAPGAAPVGEASAAAPRRAAVDAARLVAADEEPGQWMTHGRTYSEQRYSPLAEIDADNVGRLGLAWYVDLETNTTVQEATPIVVDGVMYVSQPWSVVHAYDVQSGEQLWRFNPEVPGQWAPNACCGMVNRGVAVWNGKVYVGTIDGRLIAIDAETGEPVWDVLTINPGERYAITGAPRVVDGLVLIGNGGAEFQVRGYVSAYDAETGELVWRFYTVPGNPADGFENEAMEMAAETWNGEWWTMGGGGTVWDAIVYDPETGLLYVGTGNGSPWAAEIRSPGGGDNLFLASIVALDPSDGSYRWHYQTTPAESWDYTATQPIIVADLDFDGESRRVIMQAPKNGFFYVLDAYTGELISADAYGPLNWAEGVDPATGRPIENPAARYDLTGEGFILMPGPGGANSWNPMSYSPDTGLVYIPVRHNNSGMVVSRDPNNLTGVNLGAGNALFAERGVENLQTGYLLAWDPVARQEVWRVPYDENGGRGGGTLTTAGNLVFQGTYFMRGGLREADNELIAYRADSGERLWSTPTQTGIPAAPISFELDGVQYIAVAAGRSSGDFYRPNHARLLVYRLDGELALPALPPAPPPRELNPPPATADAETVSRGESVYESHCSVCHEGGGGLFPDLRYSATLLDQRSFDSIVLDGASVERGMAAFADAIDSEDSAAVRAYIIERANQAANR